MESDDASSPVKCSACGQQSDEELMIVDIDFVFQGIPDRGDSGHLEILSRVRMCGGLVAYTEGLALDLPCPPEYRIDPYTCL